MNIGLKLIENNAQIQKDILIALLPDMVNYMNSAATYIKQNLPNIVSKAITNAPEYSSLINGQLKYELGLVDADSKIDEILNIWMTNIEYIFDPPKIVGNKIKSSFSASMIRIDFNDVLYTPFAEMQDTIRGYSLPWLQWLLLEGNAVLVPQYSVVLGTNPRSRTGNAIMTKSSSSWKIPSQFAGTASDNWITRAIDSSEQEIQQLLDKVAQL